MVTKESHPTNKIEILAITLLVVVCSLTGTGLSFLYAHLNGFDLTNMGEVFSEQPKEIARKFFRSTAAIHQIFTFILPCFLFWYIIKRKETRDYFQIAHPPLAKVLIFSFLILIISLPLVSLSAWLNQFLPLPEWAINVEADTAEMIGTLLTVDRPIEWILNVLVVAALPALGEELFFRGIVQTKFISYFKNPHLAIWLGAFFFSAFHFQFEGLFPRILLGAVLGYLYYWTRNLWIPIILHFFNNAILVSAPYFAVSDQIPDMNTDLTMSYSLLLSVLGATVFGYFLIKNRMLFLDDSSMVNTD